MPSRLKVRRLLWLLLAAACARASERTAPPEPSPVGPAAPVASGSKSPDVGPARAAEGELPGSPEAASPLLHTRVPARGCRLAQEFSLREDAARAWAVAPGGQPQFLVLRADRRTLEWWSGPAPALALRAARSFEVPISRLALLAGPARDSASVHTLAFVDDKGTLFSVRHQADQFGAPKPLAQGVDRRFAPALALLGEQVLIAFTRSVELAMHTFVAGPSAPVDVTPPGHGAAAPTFVLGATRPTLVMIDARGGVSPLLEVPFDGAGKPEPVIVRTPVSQPYAPPYLSAVAVPGGDVEVAFTAVGRLAATAIGRVPLRRAAAPSALHPSRGYGELSFGTALGHRAVVYALEVPRTESADAHGPAGEQGASTPHQIEIKWFDSAGEGQTLTLPASVSARLPSISAIRRGEFVLASTHGKTVRAALLQCDD